jgi:predicted metal-binding membrane protein
MWTTSTRDQRALAAALAGLVTLTWLALWVWDRSPSGRFLTHEDTGGHLHGVGGQSAWGAYLFLGGWTLMMVAMMLPAGLPVVLRFHMFIRERPLRLTASLVGGYLWIWTLIGFALHSSGQLVLEAAGRSAWLAANTWLLGAGAVLVAGLYQLTPLKLKCLEECRSPRSLVTAHRHCESGGQAFRFGVHHGLFSVGCCWALMLLMFAVGGGNLTWMLALAAVMAFEQNVPRGRRLSTLLGVALLGCGLALVATGGAHVLWRPS